MKQETENRQQRPQMICLCATCANAFYNVPTIRIQRVDRYQLVKADFPAPSLSDPAHVSGCPGCGRPYSGNDGRTPKLSARSSERRRSQSIPAYDGASADAA